MKGLGKKLILLSFIFALICSVVIFIYLKSLKTPKEIIEKITILVAEEDIPPRVEINKKMIKEIEVPKDEIFDVYIKETSDIVGKYTKETIRRDEGFREEKLLQEDGDDNELAFNIDAKHRAVTLNANGEAGVANLLKPRDYVDVVVYLPEKVENGVVVRPDMTKMIIQNLKVLAIDKELYRKEAVNAEEEKKPTDTFLVTLSVPVVEIERLVLAEDIGNIKLVLRPLDKEGNSDTEGAIWQDISADPSKYKTDIPLENGENPKPSSGNSSTSNNQQTKYTRYTVKKGDTLRSISEAFYGDPDKYKLIQDFNKISNKNHIINGEVIKIPTL